MSILICVSFDSDEEAWFGAGRFFFGFGKVVLHKASFCDRIEIFYQKKGSL